MNQITVIGQRTDEGMLIEELEPLLLVALPLEQLTNRRQDAATTPAR